jgi:hypothetical protein
LGTLALDSPVQINVIGNMTVTGGNPNTPSMVLNFGTANSGICPPQQRGVTSVTASCSDSLLEREGFTASSFRDHIEAQLGVVADGFSYSLNLHAQFVEGGAPNPTNSISMSKAGKPVKNVEKAGTLAGLLNAYEVYK